MTSRTRTTRGQRGYALISAIVLSVLYLALISLLLIDSSRELNEAQRFRARVMAQTLAENAVELGAEGLRTRFMSNDEQDTTMGEASWRMSREADGTFSIEGTGVSTGVIKVESTVKIEGKISGDPPTDIEITEVEHSR
ncbi:MAG TPA: hypothetical protein VF618_01150 [Thermoanaerobaculia bacterium]